MFTTVNLDQKERVSLKSLLDLIDDKIYNLGKIAWNQVAFGVEDKNAGYIFESLMDYKDIILSKMSGCSHHNNTSFNKIVSRIKKLTNG